MRDRTRVLTRARRHWLVLVLGMAVAALPTPAAAQVVAGSGNWSPGPNAADDNTYAGNIDQPASGSTIAAGSAFHVAGWVVDTTAEGWAGIDEINVYLGSAGPGG